MSIEKTLNIELLSVASDLRKAFADNNVNASGRLSNSLEVVTKQINNSINGKLYASAYIDTVDTGRNENKTNSGGLLAGIREWLKFGKYGLPDTEAVARAITTNIAKRGSYLNRNKIDRKIVAGIVNDIRIANILKVLGIQAEEEIKKSIINLTKSFHGNSNNRHT